MAKINLSKTIIGLDGKVINATRDAYVIIRDSSTGKEEFLKNAQGEEMVVSKETNEALTVKKQLMNVLITTTSEIKGADKAERYALFFRIENAKNDLMEMSAEEVSLCKKCLNEFANILVAGRISQILEGKDK